MGASFRPVRTGLAFVAVAALAAGCSSSGGPGHTTAPPSASVPASTPATSSAVAATGSSTQPLTAADTAQITRSYTTFFAGATKPDVAAGLLQHGAQVEATLAEQARSPQAKGISVQVTKVARDPSRPSPDVASVTFTVLSDKHALLPGVAGLAVREDGRWKVAAATFCQLLTLQGAAPKQCQDKAFTALPAG